MHFADITTVKLLIERADCVAVSPH